MHGDTFVFRYAAIRLLEIDVSRGLFLKTETPIKPSDIEFPPPLQIFLDRMTAETVSTFLEPFTVRKEKDYREPTEWLARITGEMEDMSTSTSQSAPEMIQSTIRSANSGRIYFEQLHLHPVRLSFTFTQEWMEWNPASQSMMLVQFIRGMVSVLSPLPAPLQTDLTQFLGVHRECSTHVYLVCGKPRFRGTASTRPRHLYTLFVPAYEADLCYLGKSGNLWCPGGFYHERWHRCP